MRRVNWKPSNTSVSAKWPHDDACDSSRPTSSNPDTGRPPRQVISELAAPTELIYDARPVFSPPPAWNRSSLISTYLQKPANVSTTGFKKSK